jgi:hypothetical protein
LAVTGLSNFGNIGNITITGGTAGQVISTDGSGNLTWANVGSSSVTVDTFSGTGTQVSYTLSVTPPSKNYVTVHINGATQLRSSFTVTGTALLFSEAPPAGSSIEVTSISSMGNVSSGGGGSIGGGGGATVSVSDTAPLLPENGALWLNSLTGDFSVYYEASSTWINVTSGSANVAPTSTAITTNVFTGDGITSNFDVGTGYSVDNLIVFDNGVSQIPTIDYTYTGANITFFTPPAAGDSIHVRKLGNSAIASGNLSIGNLNDVNVFTIAPINGQTLLWDSNSGFWIPGTVGSVSGGTSSANIATSMFVGDGITSSFNVGVGYNVHNLLVFDNGVNQVPTVDYTYVGSMLIFNTPPAAGESIQVRKLGTVSLSGGSLVINDLTDVDTSSAPANGQALIWETSTSQWKPGNVAPVLSTTSINALSDVDTVTSSPANGQVLLWNSSLSQWKPGAVSSAVVGPTGADISTVTFTGDGTSNNFVIGAGFTANTLMVFDNGVSQIPDVDYTYSTGNVIFGTAPATGSTIQVRKISTVSLAAVGLFISNLADVNTTSVAPTNNQTLSWNSGDSKWKPRSVDINWVIITSTATLATHNGYFVDTSTGSISVTLPATAVLGDTIRINDLAGTFDTNNLLILRNGNKIQGIADDLLITQKNASLGLVYSNSTYGWKLMEI